MFTHFIAPNITQLPVPMPDPRLTSPPPAPEEVAASDNAMINQLATRQDFKRGDYVVAEGDLYQRIYTVVSGEIHMNKRGRHIVTLREGEVFGYLSLPLTTLSLSFSLAHSLIHFLQSSDTLPPTTKHDGHRGGLRHGITTHHPRLQDQRAHLHQPRLGRAHAQEGCADHLLPGGPDPQVS